MKNIVVGGTNRVIANLILHKKRTTQKVMLACNKVANDVAVHAQAGHKKGADPHAVGRFETQTGGLVKSIRTAPAKVSPTEITAKVFTGKKSKGYLYPAALEFGFWTSRGNWVHYPFLRPALLANTYNFLFNVKWAML